MTSQLERKLHAQADHVGDWGGLEQEAADCWNKYVEPALRKFVVDTESDDDGERALYVSQLAWEEFCGTPDDESWMELGQRVAQFVEQYAR